MPVKESLSLNIEDIITYMNSIFQLISYSYNAFNYNHIIHRDKENNVAWNNILSLKTRLCIRKQVVLYRWKFNYNNLIP